MGKREPRAPTFCAGCGKPISWRYTRCVDCSRAQQAAEALVATRKADEALIWAIEHEGRSRAVLAAEQGVTRQAINQRYRKALARASRRTED